MKLKEYIDKLQDILEENGNVECYYSKDDEGNAINKVVFRPSILYKEKNDKTRYVETYVDKEEAIEYLDDDECELEKIVCVN